MPTPNFAIVGAARAGTTALARLLAQHPDVFVAEPKETHFYAHAGTETTYSGPGDDTMMNRRIVRDPDVFLSSFATAGDRARRGEGSVSTLAFPETSLPNIERYGDEDFRVVVMLREPVERAFSSWLYLRGRGHEPLDTFAAALAAEPARIRAGFHHMWRYRALSEYRRQLEPFVAHFGDRLLVVVLEEFRIDRDRQIARMLRFLDLDATVRLDPVDDVNVGGEPRSRSLVRIMNAVRAVPVAQSAVKRLVPTRLRERVRAGNLARPELEPALRASLGAEFAPDVRWVERLLGREVDAWRR